MVAVLDDALGGRDNVRVIRADALDVDLYGLGERSPTRIVANLPYQITSPLLMKLLADPRRPLLMVVLVQEEVARRIVAQPGDAKERGFLSVFVQSFAAPSIVRRVPARSFRPPPRIDSAVVALQPHAAPAFSPLDQHRFLALVSDAFRHRRKQLRSALGVEAAVPPPRGPAGPRGTPAPRCASSPRAGVPLTTSAPPARPSARRSRPSLRGRASPPSKDAASSCARPPRRSRRCGSRWCGWRRACGR